MKWYEDIVHRISSNADNIEVLRKEFQKIKYGIFYLIIIISANAGEKLLPLVTAMMKGG